MKIRMLTGISGLDFNLVPKEVTERFSDEEAVRLMLSDQAEPEDTEAEVALADARAATTEGNEAEAGAADADQRATRDPLDHDGDGRKGGMKGRAPKKPAKA